MICIDSSEILHVIGLSFVAIVGDQVNTIFDDVQ